MAGAFLLAWAVVPAHPLVATVLLQLEYVYVPTFLAGTSTAIAIYRLEYAIQAVRQLAAFVIVVLTVLGVRPAVRLVRPGFQQAVTAGWARVQTSLAPYPGWESPWDVWPRVLPVAVTLALLQAFLPTTTVAQHGNAVARLLDSQFREGSRGSLDRLAAATVFLILVWGGCACPCADEIMTKLTKEF